MLERPLLMKTTPDSTTIALASYLQCHVALSSPIQTAPPQIMPWAIFRYVSGAQPDQGLRSALRSDMRLYRLYRELLAISALGQSSRQAAAAGLTESSERTGEGFKLEFRHSRASAGQVYVLIVLDGTSASDRGLQLHVIAHDALLRLDFPPPIDGRSQRLLPGDSQELVLLRQTDCELVLTMP